MGLSNIEDILQAGLDGESLPTPESRIAELLKEWIEQGGNIDDILVAGSNITLTKNSDGTITIAASGEISAEDTVAREAIAEMKDGTNIDSFGDVETALATKANTATTYTKTEVDTALGSKQDTISDLSTIRSGAALGATAVQPETGKGLSTNDYTTAEKTKLAGIEAQANKTTVDDALSGSSTNPVQNKVVKSALDSKANANTTYTKTEIDTALSGKQDTLTTAQLSAVNSGIDGTKVAQIDTNKNNILSNKADVYSNWTGGKNKLTYTLSVLQSMNTDGSWNNNAWTKNGVTFTLNSDNTITVTGTLTADTIAIMNLQNYTGVSDDILTADEYGADHYIYLRGGNTTCKSTVYKEFANTDIGVSREVAIAIIGDVSSSKNVNYTFKPMVCSESKYLESPTYYPYAMSNAEITAWIIAHS